MKFATTLHVLLLACLLSIKPARADDTYVAPVGEAWLEAQTQYSEGRYAEAFANFYWAAIRDHPQAQEIVGMMYLLGPETYGPGVTRNVQEATFWLGHAGRNGREVARYLHCMAAGIGQGGSNRAQTQGSCGRLALNRG